MIDFSDQVCWTSWLETTERAHMDHLRSTHILPFHCGKAAITRITDQDQLLLPRWGLHLSRAGSWTQGVQSVWATTLGCSSMAALLCHLEGVHPFWDQNLSTYQDQHCRIKKHKFSPWVTEIKRKWGRSYVHPLIPRLGIFPIGIQRYEEFWASINITSWGCCHVLRVLLLSWPQLSLQQAILMCNWTADSREHHGVHGHGPIPTVPLLWSGNLGQMLHCLGCHNHISETLEVTWECQWLR